MSGSYGNGELSVTAETTNYLPYLRTDLDPEEFARHVIRIAQLGVSAFLAIFARCQCKKEDMLQYETPMTEEIRGAKAVRSRAPILIIEDDPSMQKVLGRTFRDRGYAVTICGEGRPWPR